MDLFSTNDATAGTGDFISTRSDLAAELSHRTFAPTSALSQRSLDRWLSTAVLDEDEDDLPYAISQFVLETTGTGQIRQYNVSALGEETVNLNIGQGLDYNIEISRTSAGDLVAIKHRKIDTDDDSILPSAQRARTVWKALKEVEIMRHKPVSECLNVLSVTGFGWKYAQGTTTMPALIVEFASHGSLRQYLQNAQKLEAEKWDIISGIVKGLLVLHSSGIVHGDIKLENVLVATASGGINVPKISDFGSSIIISTGERHSYWGSEIYNPPEIRLSGSNPPAMDYSELLRSETWAFGLLALEVFLDGKSYLDDETVNQCFCSNMIGLKEACLKTLARVRFDDPEMESKMATLLDITLRPIPSKRGSFDDVRSLFANIEENKPAVPLKKKFAESFGFIDLTDNITLRTILRGKGVSSIIPDKLPWSVQVEITNRYKKFSTAEDASLSGLAHLNLAISHYLGFGVERNSQEVGDHLRIAALQGIPEAQLILQPLSELLQFEVPAEQFASAEKDEVVEVILKQRSERPYRAPFRRLLDLGRQNVRLEVEQQDLHIAVSSNDFESALKLIREGVVDYQNSRGQTALQLACQNGNFRMAKLLIENGSDPSLVDETGLSILHFLCIFKDNEIKPLCDLIKAADPNELVPIETFSKTVWPLPDFWDELYGTPLQWAVTAANMKAVEALLELGANPANAPSWFTPIQIASWLFLSDILQLLLAKAGPLNPRTHGLFYLNEAHPFRPITIHGKDLPQAIQKTIKQLSPNGGVDIMTGWGLTPLMRISICNFSFTDIMVVRELLKICDNKIDGPHFSTVEAAIMGCNNSPSEQLCEIAFVLIDAGFSLRALSDETTSCPGWNAMHFAASGRSLGIVKKLYEKDPELLNIPSSYETKEYPLNVAAHSPYGAEMVKLLLDLGADPLAQAGYGHTPLMNCIGESRLQLDMEKFEILLKANAANGYLVQENRFTVVDIAALRSARFDHEGLPGYELLAHILSRPELKQLVNKRNDEGMTPLHVVSTRPDYTTIKLLVEAGADVFCMTPEPNDLSPFRIVLEVARQPEEGWAGKDLGPVWHKFAYRAACYLADLMASTPQDEKMTYLHIAAYCGFIEEVKRLVEQEKANLYARDVTGLTPREMLASLLLTYRQNQLPIYDGFLLRAQQILVYLNEQHTAIDANDTEASDERKEL